MEALEKVFDPNGHCPTLLDVPKSGVKKQVHGLFFCHFR